MAFDPTILTAAACAERIAAGDLTARDLVAACLDRIAAREPAIRAWAAIDPDYALAQAAEADEARAEGRPLGPLHGVPIGLKDIIDTADYPTECGSPAFAGNRPEEDATLVASLRAAGAIVLGKTVTTELATHVPAATRNPRAAERSPGGSSAGSAAAVADGMVPAAIGTQTLGSVIRPAAFCGVYGYKPSFGLIPRPGVLMQAPSLDTVGLFARSVEDLALLGDALQAHDRRDRATRPRSRPTLAATATMAWPVAPTFALIRTPGWAEADPVLREAFAELAAELGPRVVEIDYDPVVADGLAAADTIRLAELARHYGPLAERTPELLSARVRDLVERGRRIPAVAYLEALETRRTLARMVEPVFRDHGCVLTPAAPGPAPGLDSTGSPAFCTFWTLVGTPAVSVPLLEVDGLPLGVQVVGAQGDDGRLLRSVRLLVEELAGVSE